MCKSLSIKIVSLILAFSILFSGVAHASIIDAFQYGVYTFDQFLSNAVMGIKDSGYYAEGTVGWSLIDWWNALVHGDTSFKDEYSTYLSTLDSTTASSDNSIVSFHPFYEYLSSGSSASHSYSYDYFAQSIDFSGIYDTTSLTLYNKDYVGHVVGLVSSPLSLPEGQYTVPSITVTARNPYFGVLGSCCFYLSVCRYEESTGTLTELNYYKLRPSSHYLDPCSFTTNALNFYATSDYLYFVRLSFSGRVQYLDQTSGYTLSAPVQLLLNGESAVENPPASTRTASLAQAINTYNIDNSYTDNSTTVNYFLGSLDSSGAVTDVYSPALYDEETLIFTEPISGTQYQTTGWTYDYTTRSYDLTLAPGTMTVADTDITQVVCTYGDDAVTISFCDSSGTAVQTDEFAYVMASQSECNINGHTYNVETTKEPTCTAAGERTYICSICGNQYVEEIPSVSHAYEYSIYQAPTCTAAGIGLYTCSMCGDQYTEPIIPKGHTDKLLQYVPTEYDENGIVITTGYSVYECEVCGTQYTVQDEIPMEDEGWFSWLGGLFKKLISSIVNGLASGIEYLLENVIGAITDWLLRVVNWLFDLFDGEALGSFFNWFSDGNEILNNEWASGSSSSGAGSSGASSSTAVTEVDVWAYSLG